MRIHTTGLALVITLLAVLVVAGGIAINGDAPVKAQTGPPPTSNITVRNGDNAGEVVVSWDAVPSATHYRIGYVNMEVDYHLAKASCTEEWIEAFIYVDVNARNIPVRNGRAEYTVRRLSEGARHAFTVLTSNNFYNSPQFAGGDFSWPQNPRWRFSPGRASLPPGIAIPEPVCSTPLAEPTHTPTPTAAPTATHTPTPTATRSTNRNPYPYTNRSTNRNPYPYTNRSTNRNPYPYTNRSTNRNPYPYPNRNPTCCRILFDR